MISINNLKTKSTKVNGLKAEDVQRFVELGRLSASLIHEISSPLTVALLNLDELSDPKSHNIQAVRKSLIRLTRYVNVARQQLRNQSDDTSFFIDTQVKEIKRLVGPLAKSSKVKLLINKTPHIKLSGDPIKFQQILVNLIVNAIEAYPKPYKISFDRHVKLEVIISHRHILIFIIDKGPGLTETQLAKLFEPFYTTKSSGHGLGLGLVIVKQYVRQDFKGSIRVTSKPKLGTKVRVRLPYTPIH